MSPRPADEPRAATPDVRRPAVDAGTRWRLALVLLAVTALYLPSLRNHFVSWDDDKYVTANPDVRAPHPATILWPGHLTVSDWTPVVTLTYAAEYKLFGANPLVFHATNVLLHVLSVGLVATLLIALGNGTGEALLAALIFGVHPLQVESVAWVSDCKNLLAAVFGLAFMHAFLADRALLATAFLLLALGSKGTAVIFPAWAVIALLWQYGPRWTRRTRGWLLLWGLLAALRALLSARAQAGVVARTAVAGLGGRLAIMGAVFATQLRQFFAPYGLAAMYSWPPLRWSDPRVLAGWAAVLLTAAAVAWASRRDTRLAVAGCFTAVALLPTANIVPAPFFQADRYTHLALIGAALLAVRLCRMLTRRHARAATGLVLAWCVLVVAPFTLQRIAVWRTSESLWHDTIPRVPDYPVAWMGLVSYYRSIGRADEAERTLRQGAVSAPDLRYDLALQLLQRGAAAEAVEQLRQLVAVRPDRAPAHGLLGQLLVRQGDFESARRELDTALRLDPQMGFARLARAQVEARRGQLAEAERDLDVLARLHGLPAAYWATRGQLRLAQGKPAAAIDLARRASAQDPHLTRAWIVLGRALRAAGEPAAADSALAQGLQANPKDADLLYEEARLYLARGDTAAAKQAAAQALAQLGPAQRPWKNEAQHLVR